MSRSRAAIAIFVLSLIAGLAGWTLSRRSETGASSVTSLHENISRPREPVVRPPASSSPTRTETASLQTIAQEAAASPIEQFSTWSTRYLMAAADERARLETEGVRLAAARRPVFKQLIKDDPKTAIQQAVPMVVRQQLPWSIVSLIEARLNGVGVMRVLQGVPPEGMPLPKGSITFREAEFKDGKTYRAYVYGRREQTVTWTPGASLNGVALDSDFAVNEQPTREMEVGEKLPAGKTVVTSCPVSGKTVVAAEDVPEIITESTPAAEGATEVYLFCDGSHRDINNQTLIMGEGVSGGTLGFTGILPAAPTPALGTVRVLVIPMTYADQNGVPSTEAALYTMMRDVGDFYAKSSFGRLTLTSTVTPPVKLKHNEAWYVNRDSSNLPGDPSAISGTSVEHAESRDEARKLGFDSNDYDCTVVRHNGGPQSYGGLGGGSSVWLRGDGASTAAHEIGHCFGLAHANFWDTSGSSSIGFGANAEYGDSYDNMGSGPFPGGQYNAQAKNQIKWMPPSFVQNVTQSGQYRVYAMDQGVLDPARRYAMTVLKDAQKTYWGEVRSQQDTNPWIKNGMILGWRYPNGSGSNIQLIDTTPGSPFTKEDAPISLGSTFSDYESGIHMTTIALNDSPRYMDVVVNLGQFPANLPPTLALAASSDVVPTGATVTFTATASDPNGDALAYSWRNFGDTAIKVVSPNSPVITRTFATAGTYIVTCTASDMKGGTATRNQLITVGSGNSRSTISGRVTLLGAGLSDVVITANGSNGVVTDADGYFTIPNLSANTYSLTPLLYGYSFGELFNNSITVAPNFSGANFEATAQSVVTIAATIPNANELAPVTTGKFTITRTGDNSQDQVVNVNTAQGSATITTDYTFSPAYVTGSQGFSTFTILAGSSTLDVVVTPVVDTTQEGPETVILQLGVGNGYLVGSASAATVVINDDDATVPKITLAATTLSTYENSGTPAAFTVTRSGATTPNGALTVNYTITGTATSGADFTALSGSVIIANSDTSAVINVAPINDSLSEPLETVKLTLTTNAAHLIDPLTLNATVSIYDDDVQTVNVVVTDATAAEVDLTVANAKADTGTFVVTRSGDTTDPLTVYYAFAGTNGSGVTALHGVDFEAMPGSVVIPAGQTQASITILPRFDTIGEGPELVVLTLGAGATNYILGTSTTATVTINDAAADLPYIDVVNISSASEPSTSGTFRITARGGTGTGALAVSYTLGGNATVTTDYTITGTSNTTTGTSITLNNGATVTKDVVVTPVNDVDLEDLENVTLTITPSAAYQTYAPTSTASMWLRDNDNVNTVFVDTQVGTSGAWSFTEGASTSPVKFYVSRTGSTTAALVVNYTIGGTATSGTDFTALPGTITIPAGSLGADVPIVITNDTLFEGTEAITFDFDTGAYSKSAGTVMYITDNDTATNTVGFAAPSSYGSESTATVNIPVTLTPAAAGTVTVDYAVSSNTSASSSTTNTHALPYWVRVVKTGNTITNLESNDGTIWTQRGSATTVSSLGSTSYLAGIALAAGSTTATTATVDSFVVDGLSAGGTTGAETAANIGDATGTHGVASGVYAFNSSGSNIASAATADNFRFVYLPVGASANCTVTARIASMAATASAARIGVMLRSTTATGSVYAGSLVNGTGGFLTSSRTTTSAASNSPTAITTQVLPQWFRMVRAGDVFTTTRSNDGVTWTNLGNPAAQTIVTPTVLAGVAVSAASDGLLATGTFDNVSITPAPAGALLGRTVGFVNEQGFESNSGGVWSVTGSGAGISNGDEAHFVAREVTGDFTLIARVTSLTDGGTNAQAGVMIRDGRNGYSRAMHAGWVKSGSVEQRYRLQSATNAFGSGVDYLLPAGTLTFAPGDTTKNITFTVVNDTINEPNELITLQLTNAVGANVSTAGTYHGYTIVDDDSAPPQPYAGFASTTSTVAESAGTSSITVSLSAPATAAGSVDYAVTGGTATNGGVDFDLASGTLNFAIGESVKTIPLTINDDTIIDAAETIIVSLSNYVGLQAGSISSHTMTITDNDLPVVSIVANDPSAAEAALDPGQFTITRTGPTTATLSATLARTGTATSGTDFTAFATPLTLTIPIGASSAFVNVVPIQDTTNEGSETVIETISANASYTVGTPSSATVTIADDDRSTVTIVASDDTASETAGNPGQFTVTRTAPTNVALTVNLTVSGTATSGTDYTTTPATITTLSFAINDVSKTVTITPVDDSITEGAEQVTISLASGSYDIGAQSFDNVTINDNDSPPTLFINSPTTQGPLVANGNGIILSATITDDGAPFPVTQTWAQIDGPGTATIETPNAATTAVTFSAPGTYILRITATDTQFTVSDQVTVVVGSALVAANWLTQDMGPSSARRGQSVQYNGLTTVTGTGAGYSGTTDQAHVMVRQISGDGSIVARLTSLPTTGALAGVTMRDSMTRGARRAVLGYVPGTGLQFRARTTVSVADTLVATQTGLSLPLWLKLERNATTGDVIASYGSDGIAWTQIGTTTNITMDALSQAGLTTASNSTASSATAIFDNITLTPAPVGPALLTEDSGASPAAAGSSSLAGGTYTVNGSTSGYFHGWQYYGDMIVTARLVTFTSGAGSASGGIRIAESIENGGQLHLGRMPQGAYSGYYWTSIAGGSGGGVPSGISAGNWMRFIRNGNSITSYRASDVSGAPGAWTQIGQPQTVIMTTPVWVGFYVNNASGVGMNTCTFSGLTIAPLNKSPVVNTGTLPSSIVTPLVLEATVTDDNYPAPVSLTTLWTRVSGPSAVTFGNSALIDTTAAFTAEGAFKFRLFANDGGLQSFGDLLFTGYLTPWSAWQGTQFVGGSSNADAAMLLDPDHDGQCNLMEYALGTDPESSAPSNVVQDSETISTQKYLRLTVTKNAAASDVTYEVQATSNLADTSSWSSLGLVIETNTSTLLRVRDNVAMTGGSKRFMRVKVVRP